MIEYGEANLDWQQAMEDLVGILNAQRAANTALLHEILWVCIELAVKAERPDLVQHLRSAFDRAFDSSMTMSQS